MFGVPGCMLCPLEIIPRCFVSVAAAVIRGLEESLILVSRNQYFPFNPFSHVNAIAYMFILVQSYVNGITSEFIRRISMHVIPGNFNLFRLFSTLTKYCSSFKFPLLANVLTFSHKMCQDRDENFKPNLENPDAIHFSDM